MLCTAVTKNNKRQLYHYYSIIKIQNTNKLTMHKLYVSVIILFERKITSYEQSFIIE